MKCELRDRASVRALSAPPAACLHSADRNPSPTPTSRIAVTAPRRAILVFLDGVGIGADDPAYNPFAAAHLPRLEALLGGRKLVAGSFDADGRIVAERAVL